jgi:hypothetical protein
LKKSRFREIWTQGTFSYAGFQYELLTPNTRSAIQVLVLALGRGDLRFAQRNPRPIFPGLSNHRMEDPDRVVWIRSGYREGPRELDFFGIRPIGSKSDVCLC